MLVAKEKSFWRRNFGEGWVLRLGVGAAKVNNFLEMGFWQRMGAGGEGKKNLEKEFRWRKGAGGEGKKFWRRNFSEGWVLRLGVGAAKVNNFLEMGFW